FGYSRWRNRGNPGWHRDLSSVYQGRRNGEFARPPRTLAQQDSLVRQFSGNRFNGTGGGASRDPNLFRMVTPLGQLQRNNLRLNRLSAPQQLEARNATQRFRDVSQ